ncbi:Shedu anti-phage system protein SduA domain-containing protein [Serinicoccus marinus]|uniref:Shedu anti-phage system protein SduA domain-containing protein n=1 Tax=Serinicoccus marinus TaxID=247333 RepID=UPI00249102C7|nr:Shedu anti-phage system protein SduA domain-containing protein [Serinicoccus marinus]
MGFVNVFDFEQLAVEPGTEAGYAALRVLGRTTVSKSFPLRFGSQSERGQPTRTVWQVIQADDGLGGEELDEEEGYTVDLHASAGGRIQLKARVIERRGRVHEVRFERIKTRQNGDPELELVLRLEEAAAQRLVEACVGLLGIDPSGSETLKFSDDFLRALLQDPQSLTAVYEQDPDRFRQMIEADVEASDVIAIAAKREALDTFRAMLDSADEYSESDWQQFFEENSWILGVGLSSHFFASWDSERLERYVAGASIAKYGKRVDALLTTSGAIRSLVLAEIKLPTDPLLVEPRPYRAGTWSPSPDLSGGITQALVTADRAREEIGRRVFIKDDEGFDSEESFFLVDPRSYLIIGSLGSLVRDGRPHEDKYRSFEMFRRTIRSPTVLTYDEVLRRAEWALSRGNFRGVEGSEADPADGK